ncbi:MAG: cytochrome C oxidase subunit IV family protein [Dehalococcoidia bacterium]|nr:cytochrome C oxidase subunit IV family protein [Dehalococcoidia bacterium]
MAATGHNAAAEAKAQGTGLKVIAILAVLTLVEYAIAVTIGKGPMLVTLLTVAALAKTWLILQYFMHLPKLWNPDGGH